MSTSVKVVGGAPSSSTVAVPGLEQIVDPTFGAARVRVCPVDYIFQGRVLGHYRLASTTGTLVGVLNAADKILAFRWANANVIAIIERITVGFTVTATFGGTQIFDADAIIGRNYTTANTGGTVLMPRLTNNSVSNCVRANMGRTLVNDIRISTTVALGGGAVTLDANPFATGPVGKTFTIGEGSRTDLYTLNNYGQHPIILSNNEGFFVRLITAWNNNNQGIFYITLEWAEVAGY